MGNRLKALIIFVLATSAIPAFAGCGGMQKHKPLAFSEMPKICQDYFTRAEACYKKVGEKASFQQTNTKFLRDSLPAADVGERVQMCNIAMNSFKEKTQNLHCE